MLRIKAVKASVPLVSGSTSLSDKDAEMLLEGETLYVRRRGKLPAGVPRVFVIPLGRLDRLEPFEDQIENLFEGDPEPKPAVLVVENPPEGSDQLPKVNIPPAPTLKEVVVATTPVKDDEERMIKINGKVVARRGPMKPDEIEARIQAKKERAEALLKISEVEWTPEQRKLVEEYTAANPPDAVPTPPAAPAKPTSIAELVKKHAE